MDARSLVSPDSPDTPEWRELAARLDQRARLGERLGELDFEQRAAAEAATAAADTLVALERRQLSGEDVRGEECTEAERAR